MSARWRITEVDEAIVLNVELWNDCILNVYVWKDDSAAPFVVLCEGGLAEEGGSER
jgi:hypothetical protein